jgi:hypothetical protein
MYGLSVDQNFQQVKIFRSSDLTEIMSLLQFWAYRNSELTAILSLLHVWNFWAYRSWTYGWYLIGFKNSK